MAAAVQAAVERFGGIDMFLINNASAISLTPTPQTPMKRFDSTFFDVDVRGTFVCTQACLPALSRVPRAEAIPHVLNLVILQLRWFAPHVAYTMAKYGMSMCTLGHAQEFFSAASASRSTASGRDRDRDAVQMIPGVDSNKARTPQILADAPPG